jgi:hypothetical protein
MKTFRNRVEEITLVAIAIAVFVCLTPLMVGILTLLQPFHF